MDQSSFFLQVSKYLDRYAAGPAGSGSPRDLESARMLIFAAAVANGYSRADLEAMLVLVMAGLPA